MEKPVTVLVVEDSPAMRGLVRRMLHQTAISQVLDATDGRAALSVLHHKHVDLVLSDWHMHPMNGIQLLSAMRTDSATAAIPFIMMTSDQSPAIIAQAIASGVAGFLPKPFGREQLSKMLARVRHDLMHAA